MLAAALTRVAAFLREYMSWSCFKRISGDQKGKSMVEYTLALSSIALACLVTLTSVGDRLVEALGLASYTLAGGNYESVGAGSGAGSGGGAGAGGGGGNGTGCNGCEMQEAQEDTILYDQGNGGDGVSVQEAANN